MASKKAANKKKVEEPVVEPEVEEEEEVEEASEEEVEEAEEAEEAEEEEAEEAEETEQTEEAEQKPKAENTAAETQRNGLTPEEKNEEQKLLDERSVFIRNVIDFFFYTPTINTNGEQLVNGVTTEQLTEFFKSSGEVERVTLLTNKANGEFKGCGFVLFKSKDSVPAALELDGKKFQDQDIEV
ncbi:hypothetical protein RFI_15313 [Reticulomyxa filosa]|uniref:RRM domain-containing protein n=1 Tax=Reticulomyxa filosa TaxID=46433 RepID=X6N7N3_RETFI|nr:hypothetical protein RFI_15313 [Reticulomyxa filosa]|eukprot:ETO21893.1 hypothetical protein RFI_15313 [Reticulomyxa filosa]